MSQQPPPLNYANPNNAPPQPGVGRYLLWGLAIGSAFSAIIWIAGWPLVLNPRPVSVSSPLLDIPPLMVLLLVPGAKLAVALTLLILPGPQRRSVRMFGVGVLLSIAVGFLIFFGSCFAHLS